MTTNRPIVVMGVAANSGVRKALHQTLFKVTFLEVLYWENARIPHHSTKVSKTCSGLQCRASGGIPAQQSEQFRLLSF